MWSEILDFSIIMIYSQKASRRDPQIEILSYGEEEGKKLKINESFQLNRSLYIFLTLPVHKMNFIGAQ